MHHNSKKKRAPVNPSVRVEDLMVAMVMTTTPARSVGHVRKVLAEHGVSAMPVVDSSGEPIGIVTTKDLIDDIEDATPVRQVMTRSIYTISPYSDPSLAARMMRNHSIHHLVVSHEKKVVGILSSYDLLRLIEDRRFVMKNPSTPTKRKAPRAKTES